MSREYIAQTLKRLREDTGLTTVQVGEMVGKSGKTISAWENNRGQPDAEMLMQLCDIYKVDNILAEFNQNKKNPPQKRRMTDEEKKKFTADLTKLLDAYGFIGENGDISDADLEMLKGVVMLFHAYRQRRSQVVE